MKYKGFYVKYTSAQNLERENKNGEIVKCNGFKIEVFADEYKEIEIDIFSAAEGFELMKNSFEEAVQFTKDYIDSEEKEYQRIIEEYSRKSE